MTNVCKKTTLRTQLVYCSGKPQSIQVVCSPCCPRSRGHLEQAGARRASDHPFDHPSRNVPDDKTSNDPKSSNQEANAKPNFNPGTDYTDGKTQQQIGKSSSDEKNSNDLKRFERDTTKKGNFLSRSSKNDAKKRSRSTSPSNSDEKASNDSKWSGRSSNRKRKSISSSGKRESSKRSQQLSPPYTAEKSSNESKISLFGESKRSNTSTLTGMSDTKRGSQQKVQYSFDEKAFSGEKGGNLRNPNAASTLDRGATKKGLQPNEQSIYVENPPYNSFGRLDFIPPNGRDDEHKRSQMTGSSISVEKSSFDTKKSVTNNGTKTTDAALDKMDQVSTQEIQSKDVDGTGTSERKKETNTQYGNKNGAGRANQASFGQKSPTADDIARLDDVRRANANEVDNRSARNGASHVSQATFAQKSPAPGGRAQSDEPRKANVNEADDKRARNSADRVSQASFSSKSPTLSGRVQSNDPRRANASGVDSGSAKNGAGLVSQTAFGQKSPKADMKPRSDDPRKANANEVDKGSAKNSPDRVSPTSFGPRSPLADGKAQSNDQKKANASEVDNGSAKNSPGHVNQTSFGPKSPTTGGKVQSDDLRKAIANEVDNGSAKNGPGRVSQASFGLKNPTPGGRVQSYDPRKANANGVDNERARTTPAKEVGHPTISKKSLLCIEAFGPGGVGVPCDESGEADLTSLEGGSSEKLDGPNGGEGTVRKEGFKTPRSTGGIGFSGIKKGNSTTPETSDDAKKRGSRPIHSAPNVRHTIDFSTKRVKGHTAGSGFYRNHLLGAGKNYLQPKSHPSLENLQGSENRTGKERRTPNPLNRFARIEGSQYGYIDLVKELGMLDRNAVYYYIYVFLHQRDVDKELVPFETRRCIEKALETASSDEEERLRLCILNSKDRRLSKVELTTGCKIELGELTGIENCYRGLPRRRLNITGPSYVHIANAITMLEQYFPRLMRNATYPYPLPRGTTTKYETEERMATTAFRTVDHEPGNIGLRADFNDRALVTCRQVREAYEGA
ncbi:hypothetical protein [Echinococcus multilocularis]|uniref:Uncharacterized protein n=1 Tax=Echinococcus multilocularis TaxID=6211 RepID=A0A068Y8T2_ECHMU|nr:hypothetical protein [Echinococcus multilocularis]